MKFPLVELRVQKFTTTTHEQKKEGRWVTKQYLMSSEHWTKTPTQLTARGSKFYDVFTSLSSCLGRWPIPPLNGQLRETLSG